MHYNVFLYTVGIMCGSRKYPYLHVPCRGEVFRKPTVLKESMKLQNCT